MSNRYPVTPPERRGTKTKPREYVGVIEYQAAKGHARVREFVAYVSTHRAGSKGNKADAMAAFVDRRGALFAVGAEVLETHKRTAQDEFIKEVFTPPEPIKREKGRPKVREALTDYLPEGQIYFSVSDIAHILNCSDKTVRRDIYAGDIPAFKHGGKWTVDRATMERLINEW